MVIDFQSHVFPREYIEEIKRTDGNVIANVGGVLSIFCQRATNIYSGRTEEIRRKYGLKENPLDSLKRFYVDTADHPSATLRCVLDFFGPDRLVFATNYPYGPEDGCLFVRNSLKAINELNLKSEEKVKILGANAFRSIGLQTLKNFFSTER